MSSATSRQDAASTVQASSTQRPSAASSVKPILVLVAICLVAGVLLGAVHQLTAPIAAANADAAAQEVYAALVPEAASFEPVDCDVDGCTAALKALDASGQPLAHVIVSQSKGYGGPVPIAVAFGADGTVVGITAMPNDETPGLGTRIADEEHIGQYKGMPADQVDEEGIDLISGATISSRAALSAFNIAVEAYEEVR